MFKPFLQQLTKVTDLAILFATIFVFLAFITPEELSQTPLNNARDDYDRTTSSLALAEAFEQTMDKRTNRDGERHASNPKLR